MAGLPHVHPRTLSLVLETAIGVFVLVAVGLALIIRVMAVDSASIQQAMAASTSQPTQTIPTVDLGCDGRVVDIVATVEDTGGNVAEKINKAQLENPGSIVLKPGSCTSLRKYVDGALLYPVVIDYGYDREAVCDDPRGARILTNSSGPTRSSPC